MSVSPDRRFRRARPCPICGGGGDDPRGKGKRCEGFLSADGAYAHCMRPDKAGSIPQGPDRSFAHRISGPCRCGTSHGAGAKALDTWSESRSMIRQLKPDIAATYDYKNERGDLLFQVVRYIGKEFRQRQPTGDGSWRYSLEGVRRVLYRLPDVIAGDPSAPVYVVEGEKDVEALVARGHVATCNPMGSGKWKHVAEHARQVLAGRDVVIVADADEVGRVHAKEVHASLETAARSLRLLECPAPHKDVFDLLVTGKGSLDELVELGTRKEPSRAELMAPELPFDELWTPEPDNQLVIPSLGIAPGPVHLVTGTWYTGKTLLLATMGLSVASGRSLFGLFAVARGKWIHFDHEMGRRHLKRYVQRLRAGLNIDPEDMRGNLSMRVLPALNLRSEGAVDLYTELLAGCSLATIDPLRAAAPGADENKSEFREYLDMLSIVSDRTRCAIVVLHHGGKPGVVEATRRNTGRGTSAIDDAAQSKFVLSATEKGAPMLVTHEKSRELNETMPDFYLKIVNLPNAVRLEHIEVEQQEEAIERSRESREAARIGKARARIQKVFVDHGGRLPGNRKDLRGMLGGDTGTTEKALSEMIHRKEIVRIGKRDDYSFELVNSGTYDTSRPIQTDSVPVGIDDD